MTTAATAAMPYFGQGVLEAVRDNMTRTAHRSKHLDGARLPREHFNPDNEDHLRAYALFRQSGKWTRNFYAEWPSNSVPATIEKKLLDKLLNAYL